MLHSLAGPRGIVCLWSPLASAVAGAALLLAFPSSSALAQPVRVWHEQTALGTVDVVGANTSDRRLRLYVWITECTGFSPCLPDSSPTMAVLTSGSRHTFRTLFPANGARNPVVRYRWQFEYLDDPRSSSTAATPRPAAPTRTQAPARPTTGIPQRDVVDQTAVERERERREREAAARAYAEQQRRAAEEERRRQAEQARLANAQAQAEAARRAQEAAEQRRRAEAERARLAEERRRAEAARDAAVARANARIREIERRHREGQRAIDESFDALRAMVERERLRQQARYEAEEAEAEAREAEERLAEAERRAEEAERRLAAQTAVPTSPAPSSDGLAAPSMPPFAEDFIPFHALLPYLPADVQQAAQSHDIAAVIRAIPPRTVRWFADTPVVPERHRALVATPATVTGCTLSWYSAVAGTAPDQYVLDLRTVSPDLPPDVWPTSVVATTPMRAGKWSARWQTQDANGGPRLVRRVLGANGRLGPLQPAHGVLMDFDTPVDAAAAHVLVARAAALCRS